MLKTAILVFCIGNIANNVTAQVDCNSPMACNNLVQVSLSSNCTETVSASMILENPKFPLSSYTVVTKTRTGVVVPNNLLTSTSIGQTYQVSVSLNGCNISCWGSISIEDKLPPVISACPSDTVNCGESTAPGAIVRPTATDACMATIPTLTFNDVERNSQCTETFVKVITRTWTATDISGNKSSCVQTINVVRPTISNVVFPENYDGTDNPAFSCGVSVELLPNGAPSPNVTGRPGGIDCANIMTYYDDVIFKNCGASRKILRQWNVIDWCTGRDTIAAQVIKIIDDEAPICTSAEDFKFNIKTDEGKCTGTFKVPAPIVAFECSDWTYTVSYKLRDANGRPFVNAITDNVVRTDSTNGGYFYTINNLPPDTTWVVYTITDDCGNSTMCFTEIVVEDREAPTAVCEGFTVVTLDDNGLGWLTANSIDNGSVDNCGIAKYEIRRVTNGCGRPQDLNFSEKIGLCCSDVNTAQVPYQTIVFRAYDHSGNWSECTSNVRVQDKKRPIISDVPDRTINCSEDFRNTVLTGRPTITDNCSAKLDSSYNTNLKCGLGAVTVTWTATDNQGNTATSVQIITIVDQTPFGVANITWPADRTINGCKASDAHPDIINSRPVITDKDCADIATSYEDELFDVDGACKKILRTWRVINWCDANPQNPVFITHVQKITLTNSVSPVFASGCAGRTINTNSSDCRDFYEHLVTATDDCTPTEQIKYEWRYFENNDSTVDQTGIGNRYGRLYPVGTHRMEFTARDICDNISKCSYQFTIRDTKAPTPICLGNVVTVIDQTGKVDIWASDFDNKSTDLCSGNKLKFSFDSIQGRIGRTFTCADIKNGVSQAIALRVYVFDESNNREFCDVTLQLQDSQNKNICPNSGNLLALINGKVTNKSSVGFNQLNVDLKNMDNGNTMRSMTSTEGQFEMKDVPYFHNYTLTPAKSDDVLNGVNTLDLVFIQRHILGLKSITDPYDLIAADVNNDKKVTVSDLVALRKVILGVNDAFPNNKPWRFISSNQKFADINNPFDFEDYITLSNIENDATQNDFTAVKTGDVNNSAQIALRSQNTENRSANKIGVMQYNINQDKSDLVFTATENMTLSGLQLALSAKSLKGNLTSVINGKLNLNKTDYTLINNVLKISYASNANVEVKAGDVLFTIQANTIGGEIVQFAKGNLTNEMYDENLQGKAIELVNISSNDISTTTAAPNPFSQSTIISYNANSEATVDISLFDVTGRVVYTTKTYAEAGLNSVTINKVNLQNKPGIYFYKFTVDGSLNTGAIILSE